MKYIILAVVLFAGAYAQDPCGDDRPMDLDASEGPGIFWTEGFPNDTYPANANCQWRISTAEGLELELRFVNFTIESSENCKSDAVMVYDGDSTDAPLIGTYCGQVPPDPIVASGDSLYVVFTSDADVEYQGFLARYGEVPDNTACLATRPRIITEDTGAFASRDWPANYGNNDNCQYKFEGEEGDTWTITFADFEVENCCTCDQLEIFDGPDTFSPRYGGWFGTNTMPPTITSSGPDMYISFTTDFSVTFRGYLGAFRRNPGGKTV